MGEQQLRAESVRVPCASPPLTPNHTRHAWCHARSKEPTRSCVGKRVAAVAWAVAVRVLGGQGARQGTVRWRCMAHWSSCAIEGCVPRAPVKDDGGGGGGSM